MLYATRRHAAAPRTPRHETFSCHFIYEMIYLMLYYAILIIRHDLMISIFADDDAAIEMMMRCVYFA